MSRKNFKWFKKNALRERKANSKMANMFDSHPDWEKDAEGVYSHKGVNKTTKDATKKATKDAVVKSQGSPESYGKWEGMSSYHSHGSTTASFGKSCGGNHKPKAVKVGNFEVWPTKEAEVDTSFVEKMDVLCPLTDYGSAKDVYNDFCGLIMWIPIKDYSIPSIGRLLASARRINEFASKGARVGFWCVGSHGRTGTILATCIGLAEPDVDPIDAARERHCKHCVETQIQIEAVFKALGRDLPEKWKPKAEKTKATPLWVQNGKVWSPESEAGAENIISLDQTCDLCMEGSIIGGKGILHWFGQIMAHDSCYTEASAKADAERKVKAKLEADKRIEDFVAAVGDKGDGWVAPPAFVNGEEFLKKYEGLEIGFKVEDKAWVTTKNEPQIGVLVGFKVNYTKEVVLLVTPNKQNGTSWLNRYDYPKDWTFGSLYSDDSIKELEKNDLLLSEVIAIRSYEVADMQTEVTPTTALVVTQPTSNQTATADAPPPKAVEIVDEDSGTIIDQDHYKKAVANTRPFNKNWSVKRRKRFADIKNKLDQFGDLICPKCKLLIIDTGNAMVGIVKGSGDRYATHVDCTAADVDPDCHQLCLVCYDGQADEDGYCSSTCLQQAVTESMSTDTIFE